MIYSIHTKQFNNTTVRTHAHTTKKFDMPHHLQCLFRHRDRRNNETTARFVLGAAQLPGCWLARIDFDMFQEERPWTSLFPRQYKFVAQTLACNN